MNKRETTILKGLAILFMLYLHLFNRMGNVDLCVNFIYIKGIPLCHILSRCTSPVAIYVFLSGYGLYKSYLQSPRLQPVKRISKLYIHYWIAVGIFVLIGSVMRPDKYPGDVYKLLENISAWHTSYNAELWFLFPYVLVILLAGGLFRVYNKYPLKSLLTCTLLYGAGIFAIWSCAWGRLYLPQVPYMFTLVITMLLPYLIGASMAKWRIFEIVRTYFDHKQILLSGGILLLIVLRASTEIDAIVHLVYVSLLLPLVIAVKRPDWLNTALYKLGERSISMWFIHSFFCYYLFHDFIYGFRYPIVIFGVLVAVSYMSSIVIDYLNNKVQAKIFSRRSVVN